MGSRIDSLVRATRAGEMSPVEAVLAATPADVEQVLHAQFGSETQAGRPICAGIGVSPGAAVGRVYFDVDSCLDAADRGETVILCTQETTPADEVAMRTAQGVITARGGATSHAAVVARGWGLPAVCGVADLDFGLDEVRVADVVLRAGDLVSIDGTSGEVFAGDLGAGSGLSAGEGLDSLEALLSWANDIRSGQVQVLANADTAADAVRARKLGAEGIGLCRTEHMFLGERIALVQDAILAQDDADAALALEALGEQQRADFVELLNAMDGCPVTIRLLDAPLHEFLAGLTDLDPTNSDPTNSDPTNSDPNNRANKTAAAAQRWAETNPMLGTRGVRLAIVHQDLYRMQVRALLHAVTDRVGVGGSPKVEILVPLVSDVAEFTLVSSWIDDEISASGLDATTVAVGTMIETPRAALTAAELARHADFFSFGTNDLTQLTWGLSRDDVEGRVIAPYVEMGLTPASPFKRLDVDGVGALISHAIEHACATNPELRIGVCGEHGGDPESLPFLVAAGVDSISASPFRVPVARLVIAQLLAGEA